MTLYITLTLAEADTGPFNLFTDVDGYLSAIAVNVPKADLLAGYSLPYVYDGTTIVRVKSLGACSTVLDIPVGITTTTTTSSSTTSTTTSSTSTTTLPQVIPVINNCCGGSTTMYIPFSPGITTGMVLASNTEGFLGGYEIIGLPIPGIANIFPIDLTDYGSCAGFLAIFPTACT